MAESTSEMQYVRYGNTGLRVSRICLGCMSYGLRSWNGWSLEESESITMIKKAYDAGINFFDTANIYSNGESERILGKAIKQHAMPRDRIVVATKVYYPVDEHQPGKPIVALPTKSNSHPDLVNRSGLSRKHIFDAVDKSLERLGLDYIDLYQIHRLDHETSMEEIMEALHDIVKSGKVRYIGASAMKAWEFQKLNHIADKNGWTKFVSMQNLYNLLYREEEREMIPYCQDQGIALIPYSPLASGFLCGKKSDSDRQKGIIYMRVVMGGSYDQADSIIQGRVLELAEKRNISASQVALAWLFSKPHITAPIVGISKDKYLDDALAALGVNLTEDEIKYLEQPYIPKPPQPINS